MNTTKQDFNLTIKSRQASLRLWMYERNITWGDFGKVMGSITPQGACQSLGRERISLRHYNSLVSSYPDIPRELLPEPRDVPYGPRPKLMQASC